MKGFFIKEVDKLSRDMYTKLHNEIEELNRIRNEINSPIVRGEIKFRRFILNRSKYDIYWGKRLIVSETSYNRINIHYLIGLKKDAIEQVRDKRKQLSKVSYKTKKEMGFKYDTVGNVMIVPVSFLKKRYSPKDAFVPKAPRTPKNYIGVEIELCSSLNRDQLAVMLAEHKLTNKVNVHNDGSIRIENKDTPHPIELAILDTEEGMKNTLLELQKIFNNNNYEFSVNSTCGTHVHLDMRNRKHEDMYAKLFNKQDYIMSLALPERQLNTYCVPNKAATWKDAFDQHGSSRGGRYQVINPDAYNKYKTLEVRIFEGTLDTSKIINWISCLLGIISIDEKVVKSV